MELQDKEIDNDEKEKGNLSRKNPKTTGAY